MTNKQIKEIIERQNTILDGVNKLLAIHIPDHYKYETYPILDMRQAADFLNIPQTVLWEACVSGELPCRKVGSTYIFLRDALITWINLDEPKVEVKDSIDPVMAAELLGVPAQKIREWAKGYCYFKMPVIRKGSRVYFDKDQLIEWSQTPIFRKLKETYEANYALHRQRLDAAEARREAERLEKEARKKRKSSLNLI